MKLNKRQKITAAVMLPFFALAVIYPPWNEIMTDQIVFSPIWANPGKAIISVPLILLEWVCIYTILAIVLFLLRTRKDQDATHAT